MPTPEERIEAVTPLEVPKDVVDTLKQFLEESRNDVAKLPEHLFVQNLLPVLMDRSGNTDVGIWMDIAGDPFRAIDVIAPNGEVLFQVPPLYKRPETRTHYDSRHSLTILSQQTELRRQQHPAIGETFLRARLSEHTVKGGVDLDTARKWNAIVTRYGYPSLFEIPGEPVSLDGDTPSTPASGELTAGEQQEDF